MGVIKRQSIKQGLVTYLGIIIGALSTLFVYPNLGKEKFGEIQFVIGAAAFFVPFFGFGLSAVSIQFFTYFKQTKETRGRFLYVLLLCTLLSLVVFTSIVYWSKHLVGLYFAENGYLFLTYLPYILGIAFCVTLYNLLQNYISNFGRIVIPNMIYNLSLKILQPVFVLICLGGFMSFTNILDGIFIVNILIVLATFYYLYHLGYLELNTKKTGVEKDLKKQIVNYSLFSILTNASGTLALQIDKILIGLVVGASSVGIFSIPNLITDSIDVVRKAISGVAAPIISDSIKTNDLKMVDNIYKKSALLQFVIGMFLLIGAWICADDLYNLMANGKEFSEGKNIILILGLARLIDMLTGTNTEIISFSKYYRANLYMLLLLSVVNISLNLILLKQYGSIGSAYATLIAMFLFNSAKLIFI